MEESKAVAIIKRHIDDMGSRQRQLNAKIHDLNIEVQRLVDERCALESTLCEIEKSMEVE